MAMSFDARVVAVDQSSYAKGKGLAESLFCGPAHTAEAPTGFIVLIHDPKKKAVAKKAADKAETK